MNLLIIDAQGGGIGKQLIAALRENFPNLDITAVGTNSLAASAMLKAGADHAATGENPVLVGCRNADVIIGPVGIVIADSMYGEITPAMALAVGQSRAKKILIPVNQCDNVVVGVPDLSMRKLLEQTVAEVRRLM